MESSEWILFVGIEGEEIVASCQLAYWQEPHPSLDAVHVQPSFRKKGYAEQLITECIERARSAGKKAIRLTVHKENQAAIALYRKLGFKSTCDDETKLWMCIPLNQ